MKPQALTIQKVQAKSEKSHPSLFALTWPIFIEISLYMLMGSAEKCGFILEGRLRKVRYYQGDYYDSMRYGMLREEWQSLPHHSFE